MNDAARTLLVAGTLAGLAATSFVWQLRQHDREAHERLIGELRAANAAALALAVTAGSTIGFAMARDSASTSALEVAMAMLFVGVAGWMLLRSPREALFIAAVAFIVHALLDLAHRPGALSTEVYPRNYVIASALYDAWLAGLCFVARQR